MAPPDPGIDIRLIPAAVVARAGERIAFALVNRGTTPATWGPAFRVERREHDQWVLTGPVTAFRAVGYTLKPGEQAVLSVSVHDDAPPVSYLVTKDVGLNPDATAGSPDSSATGWAVAKPPAARRESVSFEFDVVPA